MSETESRRSRLGRSYFREILSQHEGSGLTLKALAESRGIKPATLYAWARRLRAAEGPAESAGAIAKQLEVRESEPLVPVRVVGGRASQEPFDQSRFELVIRGDVEVRVPGCFDEEALVRLVQALRGGC